MSDLPQSRTARLEDVLATQQLAHRVSRPPNFEAENRALVSLARELAARPSTVMQRVADVARDLCRADSAGISVLDSEAIPASFRWHAAAGQFASKATGAMPWDTSPCGTVIDRNTFLLFSQPHRHFSHPMLADPPIVEALVAPFNAGDRPVGTVWVIAHTPDRQFDAEDVRLLTVLSHFTGAAYQLLTVSGSVRMDPDLSVLNLLHGFTTRLLASHDLSSAVEETLDAAIALQGADYGAVQLYNSTAGVLDIVAHRGFGRSFLDAFHRTPAHEGDLAKSPLCTGRQIVVEDIEASESWQHYRRAAAAAGFRALQCTPLLSRDGETLGILSTYFRLPRRFSQHDLRVLELYGRTTAGLIERIREEAVLQASEDRLRDADRRRDEFLVMLGNELRTPLVSLRAVSDYLLRPANLPTSRQDDEMLRRSYAQIDLQVSHLTRLVDDLLDISRMVRGPIELQKEPVDFRRVAEKAVEAVMPAIDAKRHDLIVSMPVRPLFVEGDFVRLIQIVSSLLSNAARFTDPGGRISLSAERDGEDAVMRIRDDGIGIDPEMIPAMFEPFSHLGRSTDRPHGLGLGLPIARRIAEMHAGRIEVVSAGPGQGSEFIVRLPAHDFESTIRPTTALSRVRNVNVDRVLVLDADPDVAQALEILLRNVAAEVQTAWSAREALELVRTFRPDVILIDMEMPGVDGFELIRLMRAEPGMERIVAVALTAYGQEEDRLRSREAGFDRHWVKPVSRSQIDDLFRSLW